MSLNKIVSCFILGLGVSSFADSSVYCREVKSGGMFGQPAGVREHCVEVDFEKFQLVDNASTFFGNPPEHLMFRLNDKEIEVARENRWESAYVISEDGMTLENSAGAVLTYRGQKKTLAQ